MQKTAADLLPIDMPDPDALSVHPSQRTVRWHPSNASVYANSMQTLDAAVIFDRRSPTKLPLVQGTAALLTNANEGSGYLTVGSTSPVQGRKYTFHVTVEPLAWSGGSHYRIFHPRLVTLVTSKLLCRLIAPYLSHEVSSPTCRGKVPYRMGATMTTDLTGTFVSGTRDPNGITFEQSTERESS